MELHTEKLQGKLLFNKSLAKFTTFNIGGIAKRYYVPKNLDDLSLFLKSLPENEEILFLGLGSNLLIRDGGFLGTVIHLFKTLNDIEVIEDKEDSKLLKIGAGVTCSKVAKFCEQNQLIGAEFFAGIPGTMGGALAINAGAFGYETWQYVKNVEVINRCGKVTMRLASDFEYGYRQVINIINKKCNYEPEWFTSGFLRFVKEKNSFILHPSNSNLDNNDTKNNNLDSNDTNNCDSDIIFKNLDLDSNNQYGDNPKSNNSHSNNQVSKKLSNTALIKNDLSKDNQNKVILQTKNKNTNQVTCQTSNQANSKVNTIKELLKKRSETQPIGSFTCGSVFCNPPGLYAAKLIEKSKLKGKKIGNAMVSTKHANFIINCGNASAEDVEQLIDVIIEKVWLDHKVRLKPEVKIVGIKGEK